jgi:hypothetical protein
MLASNRAARARLGAAGRGRGLGGRPRAPPASPERDPQSTLAERGLVAA